jgi:hypothetical protein
LPSAEVGQLVLHGFAQITTQALRLCAERDIGVHWVTLGGGVIGSFAQGAAAGHRHLRQFAALDGAGSSRGHSRAVWSSPSSRLSCAICCGLRVPRGAREETTS